MTECEECHQRRTWDFFPASTTLEILESRRSGHCCESWTPGLQKVKGFFPIKVSSRQGEGCDSRLIIHTSSWYEDWWKINYQVVKNPKATCHWLLRLLLKFQVVKSFPFFPVKLINYSESCKSEWFFVAKVQRWPSLTGPWPTTRDCCICYSAASGGSCGCWDRRKTWKECCGRSFGVVLWPKCALKIWESNLGNWSSADLAQDMNVKPLAKDRWGFQEIGFRFQHAKVWWRKSNHVLREISSLAQQWVLWAPVPRVDFGWECIESGTPQQNNMKCLGNQLVDVQVRHSGWIDDRSKFFFDAFVHVAIVFCPWK